ncbi:MAG: hypothetical protein PHX26_01350 [Proteiniphilum sp.]|nr:hypothetical protein [Proteiniphilum sp.]
MKQCKKGFLVLAVLMLSLMLLPTVQASAASAPECEITLDSSSVIEGTPLYETDMIFTVTNISSTRLDGLVAYLSFADMGIDIIYDDEFGNAGESTVHLKNLEPGESTTVTIPLQMIFAGEFRITALVVDPDSGAIAASDAVSVSMTRPTAMNNTLVIIVAAIVPLICAGAAIALTVKKRKKAQ